jgi:uncharacterized secreted protein with C-terminal beta-propeller domain
MARRKQGRRFSTRRAVESGRTALAQPARPRRRLFQFERLEDRLLMTGNDAGGPGFVHHPYEPPTGTVVGQVTISAINDYLQAYNGSANTVLNVLANDSGPSGQGNLRITEVSDTRLGNAVSISADGRSLVYTPAAISGFVYGSNWYSEYGDPVLDNDSFYYVVEDDAGNISKANVSVAILSRLRGPINDGVVLLEDAHDVSIDVLSNDRDFAGGTITAVGESTAGGSIRIADDGRSIFYSPAVGFRGYDSFTYTVRNSDGDTGIASVSVQVDPRFEAEWDVYQTDTDGPEVRLNVLANDIHRDGALTPEIVEVTNPTFGGAVTIAADGQSLLFKPAPGFVGTLSFGYTVRYGSADYQLSTAQVSMTVVEPFLAVDNWFMTNPESVSNTLDVLANDPILADGRNVIDTSRQLQITSVGAGSAGGQVRVSDGGTRIIYTPKAGFVGDETFSYTVADETGYEDTASVTVHVATPVVDPFNLPRFREPAELEQWLLDEAVKSYAQQFGAESQQFIWQPVIGGGKNTVRGGPGDMTLDDDVNIAGIVNAYFSGTSAAPDHSTTNVQHAGIDEADVVETDGNYLYAFSGGKLVIVDVRDLAHPQLVSVKQFDDQFTEMYLQGDRLTLIDRGTYSNGAVVSVLDIGDRSMPKVLERTQIDGQIVDTRAIGDRVHVVTQRWLSLPAPEMRVVSVSPVEGGDVKLQVSAYETLHQYEDRVRGHLAELSLPMYHTYDGAGELMASGLLSDADQTHRPVSTADRSLLSVVTFDAGDSVAGPIASTGLFTDSAQQIYVSESGVYVLRAENDSIGNPVSTQILKFAFEADGTTSLEAVGSVRGTVHDQFSLDEHDGQLRVVTTEVVRTYWGQVLQRQNHLYVLAQVGTQLTAIGSLEDLAPTEEVKSVRFVGDRAYIVTFRVIDPLFAVDLSDPTTPRIAGAIHIPGFSDYLQPIGEDYLLGFGQDANEITGVLGASQVSLFYVGDINHPQLVDRLTLGGAEGISSEAYFDHHAIAYFAEHHVLSIPISWQTSTEEDTNGDGVTDSWINPETHSAAFVFRLNVDQGASGSVEYAGRIEHDSQVRRSVRIGDALVTISNEDVKINDINNLDHEMGEVHLGALPRDDSFTIAEDSGANVLDVRANDRLGVGGEPLSIVSVTQPTRPGYYGIWGYSPIDAPNAGTVTIGADGKSVVFTPAKDFFGTATFTYVVFDDLRGEQTATVTVTVANVPDDPIAADDGFVVAAGAQNVSLDVLANDINVDAPANHSIFNRYFADVSGIVTNMAMPVSTFSQSRTLVGSTDEAYLGTIVADQFVRDLPVWGVERSAGLTITGVGSADHGGALAIGENGANLIYTPAAGFDGIETFTYTPTTEFGRSSTATVVVRVGVVSDEAWATAIAKFSQPAEGTSETRLLASSSQATPFEFAGPVATVVSSASRSGAYSGRALSQAANSSEAIRQAAGDLLSLPLSHLSVAGQRFAATDHAINELMETDDSDSEFSGVDFSGVDGSIQDLVTPFAVGFRAVV